MAPWMNLSMPRDERSAKVAFAANNPVPGVIEHLALGVQEERRSG